MKKVSKFKKLGSIFAAFFAIGAIVVSHVALKKKCDDMIKQKIVAQEELAVLNTKKNNLFAKYQFLSSEDRIVEIALNELNMVFADPPVSVISIENEKMMELQALLEEHDD